MWLWVSVRISPLAAPKIPKGGADQQWAANLTSPDCLASGTFQGLDETFGKRKGGGSCKMSGFLTIFIQPGMT